MSISISMVENNNCRPVKSPEDIHKCLGQLGKECLEMHIYRKDDVIIKNIWGEITYRVYQAMMSSHADYFVFYQKRLSHFNWYDVVSIGPEWLIWGPCGPMDDHLKDVIKEQAKPISSEQCAAHYANPQK